MISFNVITPSEPLSTEDVNTTESMISTDGDSSTEYITITEEEVSNQHTFNTEEVLSTEVATGSDISISTSTDSTMYDDPHNTVGLTGIIIIIACSLIVIILLITGNNKKSKSKKANTTLEIDTKKISKPYDVGKLHNIGNRNSQQDSFAVSDISDEYLLKQNGIMAIVADGMGGLADGDKISSMVTLSLFKYFHENTIANPSEALMNMLKIANDEVNSFLGNNITKCGSTLVAGIIKDKTCHWISVGDSRIYLYRKGSLMQLNREHTYKDELDAKAANGEISREAALNNPQRNALTSYIGMGRLEKIDSNSLTLLSGDRILFMTDGVFGTVNDDKICDAMNLPLDQSVDSLESIIKSYNKTNQDNYTALILECN